MKIFTFFISMTITLSSFSSFAKPSDIRIITKQGSWVTFSKNPAGNIVVRQCRKSKEDPTINNCFEEIHSPEAFKELSNLSLKMALSSGELAKILRNDTEVDMVKIYVKIINDEKLYEKIKDALLRRSFNNAENYTYVDMETKNIIEKSAESATDKSDYKLDRILDFFITINGAVNFKMVDEIKTYELGRVYTYSDFSDRRVGTIYSNIAVVVLNGFASVPLAPLESLFVKMSSGSFKMGSSKEEPGRFSNEGQVDVTLTKNFAIMKTEVTQLQYFKVMGSLPEYTPYDEKESCPDSHIIINNVGLCPLYPIGNISYKEIVKNFLPKLNSLTGKKYRLPTEAEWEYAARAGTTTPYSFGSNKFEDYVCRIDFQWSNRTYVQAVAMKLPNPAGLYDMHGNAAELVEDHYQVNLPGGNDPLVVLKDSYQGHVMRGGSIFHSYERAVRSAYRNHTELGDRGYASLGFRLVLDMPAN